jgi:UDP-3-O-[3-hydroxymyristoyl] glucosamine N-acyltransferase
MPSFSLGDLAELLGCKLAGDPHAEITGVSTIEKAGSGEITFLANMKYAPKLRDTRATAVIAAEVVKGTPAATLITLSSAAQMTALRPRSSRMMSEGRRIVSRNAGNSMVQYGTEASAGRSASGWPVPDAPNTLAGQFVSKGLSSDLLTPP